MYESRPLSAAQAYDVTKFIDQHPGGRTQFIVAAGRDVSVIFRSYHKDETFK
jgi:cytochrome b involved in lipid metabolism